MNFLFRLGSGSKMPHYIYANVPKLEALLILSILD